MSPFYGLNPLALRLDDTVVIEMLATYPDIKAGTEAHLDTLRDLAGLPPKMNYTSRRTSAYVCDGWDSWCCLEDGHKGPCRQED